MSHPDRVDDDEIILVHVPSGERWQARGPRVTSGNFKLRKPQNETGKSVMRAELDELDQSAKRLLSFVQSTPESLVAFVRVSAVRDLGFEVVSTPLEGLEEHAEIRSAERSLDRGGDRKRLANLFQIYTRPDSS